MDDVGKLESQIAELLKAAEPLRKLPDDDPKKDRLTGLVDKINALREVQAQARAAQGVAQALHDEAVWQQMADKHNEPTRDSKRKARVEGDDA